MVLPPLNRTEYDFSPDFSTTLSCESRSCSGHCDNDEHFAVSSSCISVVRGTKNMPSSECNETISVDVLSSCGNGT